MQEETISKPWLEDAFIMHIFLWGVLWLWLLRSPYQWQVWSKQTPSPGLIPDPEPLYMPLLAPPRGYSGQKNMLLLHSRAEHRVVETHIP